MDFYELVGTDIRIHPKLVYCEGGAHEPVFRCSVCSFEVPFLSPGKAECPAAERAGVKCPAIPPFDKILYWD